MTNDSIANCDQNKLPEPMRTAGIVQYHSPVDVEPFPEDLLLSFCIR